MTRNGFRFTIGSIPFDEDYRPAETTRATTNFANLARGAERQANLRATLRMIDNRFNALACWDNPAGDRYSVELTIISAGLAIDAASGGAEPEPFPLIEILKTVIVDHATGERIDGIVGNNFSSYVRDYDFAVVLPEHRRRHPGAGAPEGFGELHGNLFRHFLASAAYRDRFAKPPVICLSVSSSQTYHRTANVHPILGVEYRTEDASATDGYFAKMGMTVRYFMPRNAAAPLAFYHIGDLVGDYGALELAATISTMETFQKIYRPEIYNAGSAAGSTYTPSLAHEDFSRPQVEYDRDERSRLGVVQGRFAQEHFVEPHRDVLERWLARSQALVG